MVSLRLATIKDAKLLLAWRNDPLTREASRNSGEVPWENHVAWLEKSVAWLEKSLLMSERKLYIAEEAGVPVGTVRADRLANGVQELSWTIAPEARGRGLAKEMVFLFVRKILPGESLLAVVKAGNTASEKIAEALGLHPASPDTALDTLVEWR